jgi:hypothetical protein
LIPFKNGIPNWGWLYWFKKCTRDLSFYVVQGLKIGHAKGLCLNNVATFYDNLQHAYDLHNYDASKIWNCDEFSAQVDRIGGALMLTKARSKSMHSITPNKENVVNTFLHQCTW